MDLEVLVATMGQTELSLPKKMNITRDAVIANQCDQWGYEEKMIDGCNIRLLSTNTKGVGINRNLALQLAKGDILLFADDDVTYYDDGLDGAVKAFQELPDADVIFFAMDYTRDGKIFDRRHHKTKRLHPWNSLRYGAARMAIRREAVEKHAMVFSSLFGGGCRYCSGEDTLFIIECFRSGLRVYSHTHVIGQCAKDNSSWFTGYNEKFFYDKGALLACAFPKTKHLMKFYFACKLKKRSELSMARVLELINSGIRGFRTMQPYRPASKKEEG